MKQRLTGAVVLISLAVIFLPMFLAGRDEPSMDDIQIPPKPEDMSNMPTITGDIALHEEAMSTPPVRQKVIETPVTKEVPKTERPQKEELTQEAQDLAQKAPEKEASVPAWVVQVGSFSSDRNAIELRDRLRKLKFSAYVEELKSGQTKVYRVRVGPELSEKRAQTLKNSLHKEAQLDGVIMKHR